MVDGLQFGMEGPSMQGTWINPKNGHKFTVKDSYFEDNEYKVITTQGQVLDYNMLQHYVQYNDEHGKPIEPPKDIQVPQPQSQDLPPEIADMIDPDDNIPGMSSPLGNLAQNPQNRPKPFITIGEDAEDEDMMMVRRVLRKHDEPQIGICWDWNVPKRQLDTLVNILGVEPETIAKYYIEKINTVDIMSKIRKDLEIYINTVLSGADDVVAPFMQIDEREQPKEETSASTISKPKTTKKTTKTKSKK